jgi:sn-glycerol 3-phosphate transport system ATP-binding protein
MTGIRLDDISKVYPGGVTALDGVSLTVNENECLALVGPSGCGKTTLLRVVAGLEAPSSGTVALDERVVNGVPPHRRNVSMAFQRPALLAGRSVRENLAWSWTLSKPGFIHLLRSLLGRPRRTAIQERHLEEIARMLRIDTLLPRRAGELSGGQQQRVALGRALLRKAPVRLLDEPLGHLESPLRLLLRRDLRLLSRRFPATMVHVTHDPAEALAVGDRVAVLHGGQLQQHGTPADVLHQPANRFVAAFLRGEEPLNLLEGRLCRESGSVWLVVAPWLRLAVPVAVQPRLQADAVAIGIAAQQIKILPVDRAKYEAGPIMDVAVVECASRGRWVTCERDTVWLTGLCSGESAISVGSKVMLTLSLDNVFWFDLATGVTLSAPAG